jgi:hypothetical protein
MSRTHLSIPPSLRIWLILLALALGNSPLIAQAGFTVTVQNGAILTPGLPVNGIGSTPPPAMMVQGDTGGGFGMDVNSNVNVNWNTGAANIDTPGANATALTISTTAAGSTIGGIEVRFRVASSTPGGTELFINGVSNSFITLSNNIRVGVEWDGVGPRITSIGFGITGAGADIIQQIRIDDPQQATAGTATGGTATAGTATAGTATAGTATGNPIPEPSSILVWLVTGCGVVGYKRFKKRAALKGGFC